MTGKKGFARLLEIAGEKRGLLIAAGLFSAVSAVCMLMPYVSVYFILRELLEHAASPALADGAKMIRWGVIAIAGFTAGLAATYAGGLIAHIAAFRILYGLRIRLAGHIGKLPLGWLSSRSTGAVKKTLEDNVDRVELFIAHQLPDLVHAAVTLMVMIAVMFSFNVWLAIACILPMVIGVAAQFLSFASPKTRSTLKSALDALERMNASAVQYVRGMPAVKVFGQTVHSFRQFYQDMVRYRDHGVMLTQLFQNGNLTFKVILNSLAAFILPVGVFLLNRDPGSITAASAVLFFLVMAPGIAAPMFKLMYLMENTRLINEGVERFDRILAEPPLPEPEIPRRPASFDVTFDHVFFSYGTEPTDTDALADISFTARQGEVTALVGPSGGQVDRRPSGAPLLEREHGGGPHRRRGHPRHDDRRSDGYRRLRVPGLVPVLRHRVQQYRGRPAGRGARRGVRRGAGRAVPRVHREAAARIRHTDRGRRRPSVRRRGAADQRGQGDSEERPDPRSGRSDRLCRPGERARDAARAQGADEGQDGARHRAPPVDHPGRGPDSRDGGRQNRRAGQT
jgi:hypothetical protein